MKTVPLSRISLHAYMLNIKFKYALKFFQKWSFVKRCCTETYALLAKKKNLCQTMNQWLTVQTILYIDVSIFHVLIWDTWREANIPAMFFLFFFFFWGKTPIEKHLQLTVVQQLTFYQNLRTLILSILPNLTYLNITWHCESQRRNHTGGWRI